jgi:hypothetical protein
VPRSSIIPVNIQFSWRVEGAAGNLQKNHIFLGDSRATMDI